MKPKLHNNYALITGAAGLLGPMHAEALAEKKINLILVDINKTRLDKCHKTFKTKYKNLNVLKQRLDITKEKSVENLFKKLKKHKINVNCLINNAENNPKMLEIKKNSASSVENYKSSKLKKDIEVGIIGTFNCGKYSIDRYNWVFLS